MDGYLQLVWGAANRDSKAVMKASKELGFLTGDESHQMNYAHEQAALVMGEPFLSPGNYDFYSSNLAVRMSKFGDTFMKHRLTAPPREAYSLHRKLAGAFLLCIKLRAVIPCRDVLASVYEGHTFGGSSEGDMDLPPQAAAV